MTRTGDESSHVIVRFTFLAGGDVPLLVASTNVSGVSSTVGSIEDGGLHLLPIPGSYLTAPSPETEVSVRVRGQTHAVARAADWDARSLGCFLHVVRPSHMQTSPSRTQLRPSLKQPPLSLM